jgi:hypothetical protein
MKTSAALLLPMLVMGGVSCGPTTDTLQAPFDITSSTSPGSSAPTGPARARQHLERFVAFAYESVSGDIAQGHGEYLTSLAVLAGIPTDSQAAFRVEMQSRYAVMSDPHLSRKEARTLMVDHAWSAGYGRTHNGHDLSAKSGS